MFTPEIGPAYNRIRLNKKVSESGYVKRMIDAQLSGREDKIVTVYTSEEIIIWCKTDAVCQHLTTRMIDLGINYMYEFKIFEQKHLDRILMDREQQEG